MAQQRPTLGQMQRNSGFVPPNRNGQPSYQTPQQQIPQQPQRPQPASGKSSTGFFSFGKHKTSPSVASMSTNEQGQLQNVQQPQNQYPLQPYQEQQSTPPPNQQAPVQQPQQPQPQPQQQQPQQPQQQQPPPPDRRSSVNGPPPPPLHPELRSFVSLAFAHVHKIYFSGPLVRKIERTSDGGKPNARDGEWTDVWAQLGGTTLSIWEMKEIELASKLGKEVPPSYVNVTDAFVSVLGSITVPSPAGQPAQKYSNVLTLNTAGSNLMLFSCPSGPSLVSWTAALRLAGWEKSRLEEIYTAHLLRMTLSDGGAWKEPRTTLLKGRMEGWAQVRIAGQTDWKRVWVVLSVATNHSTPSLDKQVHQNQPGTPSPPSINGSSLRRISNLFGSGGAGQPVVKSSLALYPTTKARDRRKPLLTLYDVTQAFAVYPERPEMISKSTLIKVEGSLGDEEAAANLKGREGWVLIMPQIEDGSGRMGVMEMLKWIVGLHDTFELYGRPKAYTWDPRDPVSMMFAYPFGPLKDHLFLDRELAEGLDPRDERTSIVRSRLLNILVDRMHPASFDPNAPPGSQPPSLNMNGGPPQPGRSNLTPITERSDGHSTAAYDMSASQGTLHEDTPRNAPSGIPVNGTTDSHLTAQPQESAPNHQTSVSTSVPPSLDLPLGMGQRIDFDPSRRASSEVDHRGAPNGQPTNAPSATPNPSDLPGTVPPNTALNHPGQQLNPISSVAVATSAQPQTQSQIPLSPRAFVDQAWNNAPNISPSSQQSPSRQSPQSFVVRSATIDSERYSPATASYILPQPVNGSSSLDGDSRSFTPPGPAASSQKTGPVAYDVVHTPRRASSPLAQPNAPAPVRATSPLAQPSSLPPIHTMRYPPEYPQQQPGPQQVQQPNQRSIQQDPAQQAPQQPTQYPPPQSAPQLAQQADPYPAQRPSQNTQQSPRIPPPAVQEYNPPDHRPIGRDEYNAGTPPANSYLVNNSQPNPNEYPSPNRRADTSMSGQGTSGSVAQVRLPQSPQFNSQGQYVNTSPQPPSRGLQNPDQSPRPSNQVPGYFDQAPMFANQSQPAEQSRRVEPSPRVSDPKLSPLSTHSYPAGAQWQSPDLIEPQPQPSRSSHLVLDANILDEQVDRQAGSSSLASPSKPPVPSPMPAGPSQPAASPRSDLASNASPKAYKQLPMRPNDNRPTETLGYGGDQASSSVAPLSPRRAPLPPIAGSSSTAAPASPPSSAALPAAPMKTPVSHAVRAQLTPLGRKPSGARAPPPRRTVVASGSIDLGSLQEVPSQPARPQLPPLTVDTQGNRQPTNSSVKSEMDDHSDILAALTYAEYEHDLNTSPPRKPLPPPASSSGPSSIPPPPPPVIAPNRGASASPNTSYPSTFATSKAAADRKAKAQDKQAAVAPKKPGRAGGAPKKQRAKGAWNDSSEEEEEEEEDDDADSDDAGPNRGRLNLGSPASYSPQQGPAYPQQHPTGGHLPGSSQDLRRLTGTPPSNRPSPDHLAQGQRNTRLLPSVPGAGRVPSGNFPRESGGSTPRGGPQYDDGLRPQYEDLQPSHQRSHSRDPPPQLRQNIWSNALNPGASGTNPPGRDTFVNLEPESETMTKVFMPQGLLQAGLQDKHDRSAKRQEELARETGGSLINVPSKPLDPQSGLIGAVSAHERDRKKDGGLGAHLTKKLAEERMAEERQRKIDENQRLTLDHQQAMSQAGGSMYDMYGNPAQFQNPMMTGQNPMMMNPMMMNPMMMNPMMMMGGWGGMSPGGAPNQYQMMAAQAAAAEAYQRAMMTFSQAGSVANDSANPSEAGDVPASMAAARASATSPMPGMMPWMMGGMGGGMMGGGMMGGGTPSMMGGNPGMMGGNPGMMGGNPGMMGGNPGMMGGNPGMYPQQAYGQGMGMGMNAPDAAASQRFSTLTQNPEYLDTPRSHSQSRGSYDASPTSASHNPSKNSSS